MNQTQIENTIACITLYEARKQQVWRKEGMTGRERIRGIILQSKDLDWEQFDDHLGKKIGKALKI